MLCLFLVFIFFFFKQKTAYEMRISDWSSDVCSSDLDGLRDTGFKNADLGGQIKAGINYELDRGRIWADIKYLNDRSAFYTAVPITSPLNGESLERLIDPRAGTLTSNAFRRVTLRTIGAQRQAKTVHPGLEEGITPTKIKNPREYV